MKIQEYIEGAFKLIFSKKIIDYLIKNESAFFKTIDLINIQTYNFY